MMRRTVLAWSAGFLTAASTFAGHGHAADFPKPLGVSLLPGVPQLVTLGVDYRLGPSWSAGVTGGGFPLNLTFSGQQVKVSPLTLQARGRWHPFGGAFLLGVAVGWMRLTGSGTDDIPVGLTTVPITAEISANIPHVTPHFGWIWGFGSGFILGFEFGAQVPLGASSSLTATLDDPSKQALFAAAQQTAQYQQLEDNVENAADRVFSNPFPYVTVFRLGYSF